MGRKLVLKCRCHGTNCCSACIYVRRFCWLQIIWVKNICYWRSRSFQAYHYNIKRHEKWWGIWYVFLTLLKSFVMLTSLPFRSPWLYDYRDHRPLWSARIYTLYKSLEDLLVKAVNNGSYDEGFKVITSFYKDDLNLTELSIRLKMLSVHFAEQGNNKLPYRAG